MKKKNRGDSAVVAELGKKGWPKFLWEQIESHRTLMIKEIIRSTGHCRNTVLRHVRRFTNEHPEVTWKNPECLDTAAITLPRRQN